MYRGTILEQRHQHDTQPETTPTIPPELANILIQQCNDQENLTLYEVARLAVAAGLVSDAGEQDLQRELMWRLIALDFPENGDHFKAETEGGGLIPAFTRERWLSLWQQDRKPRPATLAAAQKEH